MEKSVHYLDAKSKIPQIIEHFHLDLYDTILKKYEGTTMLRLFTFYLLLFATLYPENIFAQSQKSYNVLVLQSYHNTLPWSQQVTKGLQEYKNSFNGNIEFYIEILDITRLNKGMNADEWREYLHKKYTGIKIDGIVLESRFAADFFEPILDELFVGVPKIMEKSQRNSQNSKDTLLFNEIKSFMIDETIHLAESHNPDLKNIYIIKSNNPAGEVIESKLLQNSKLKPYKIELINTSTMEELKERLSKLPKNSAIFYTINFNDNSGKKFVPQEFLRAIAIDANAPIYSFYSTLVEAGSIGGMMIDGTVSIRNTVDALLKFIETKEFVGIVNTTKGLVNYEVMQRFNISNSSTPKSFEIIKKPVSLWDSNPKETSLALGVILLLAALLLFTIMLRKRDKKIEYIEKNMLIQSRQAAMGEMISVIAHQWRQPLNNVSAMTQTLYLMHSLNKLDEEFLRNFNDGMKKQIAFMSQTINDFRDFYKPNKKKERLDLNSELSRVINLLEETYQKEGIQILKGLHEECYIVGYPNELGQCFLSLMENAKDAFKDQTSDDKSIRVHISQDENHCTIVFEDNAGGIPSEIIDKVFDPYFSTKDDPKGTGLGLYMVKMIIQRHLGGVIRVENTKDGAKFTIRLKK